MESNLCIASAEPVILSMPETPNLSGIQGEGGWGMDGVGGVGGEGLETAGVGEWEQLVRILRL